ncbi:hypothetical protein [Paenibacillus puerhi]|uniref:hypothetical protein n=1 Tax=Paenibacillus puerhi TaxID=2692622 RepID=UPI00135BAA8F|nr:hypothetical protein [Paenibacillus puerhi]
MEKNRYYVSVQSKTIMLQQGDAAYEFEIDATPEEILQLQDLFEEEEDFENETFFRTPLPGIPYHHDRANDGYDFVLTEIYQKLHDLGTKETKAHIKSMHILNTDSSSYT